MTLLRDDNTRQQQVRLMREATWLVLGGWHHGVPGGRWVVRTNGVARASLGASQLRSNRAGRLAGAPRRVPGGSAAYAAREYEKALSQARVCLCVSVCLVSVSACVCQDFQCAAHEDVASRIAVIRSGMECHGMPCKAMPYV